jgi:hypothetical protein
LTRPSHPRHHCTFQEMRFTGKTDLLE